MSASGSPYVGSGQPDPLESFTALYLQLIKHCIVETRLWFDLKQYQSNRKTSAWTDIDVFGVGKSDVYIVQCKNWPENDPKTLKRQFDAMYEHAMKAHKALMANKNRYYVLACMECSKEMERKLREQLANPSFYNFCVWKFEDMADALIWYVNKHCQDRSLKLDNPTMWLLRNLVWYHLIVEDAWYDSKWEKKSEYDEKEIYSELWNRVASEVYKTRRYNKMLSQFIRKACSKYLTDK